MDSYDRMNPTLHELLERLIEYSKITYGTEAYPLSVAEVALIATILEVTICHP